MKSHLFSFFVAFRYLKSKKSVHAINIISRISVFAVTVLAASMIVLLSVFNGFESLLKDLYKAFYPEVKVSTIKGKWLDLSEGQIDSIRNIEGIAVLSRCAEDMALLFKDESQKVVLFKGVDRNWYETTGMDSFIIEGGYDFSEETLENNPAIFGLSIANEFSIDVRGPLSGIDIYYPSEDVNDVHLEQSLKQLFITGRGVFSVQTEFDNRYIVADLSTAHKLFDNGEKISSLEIKLDENANEKKIIEQIQKIAGENVKVQNQYEQNKTIYMVMKSEKLAIYIILSFVLIVASFTMVGVLSMIAIDKRKDVSIMKTIGVREIVIYNIFMINGVLMSALGAIIGIVLGLLICLGQQYFGWIQLEQGFIIDQYPVDVQVLDILIVFLIVVIVGSFAAFFPAQKAKKVPLYFREE